MNLLQKQGFFNSLILYAGVALGFFNLIILFQRILITEEIGFFILMGTISLLYAQFAGLGIGNIILKYFPYYRSDDKKHSGFASFVTVWSLIGFAIFTVLFVVFKDFIISYYKNKNGAPLLIRYFYYLIPLSFFTLVFSVLENLALTVFKNVLSSFLREVGLRLFTTAGVLLIAIKLVDYHVFLMIYIAANLVAVLVLLAYIRKGRHFKFSTVGAQLLSERKTFFSYGVFTVLSGSSFVMIQNLDTLMLSMLTKESFSYVGIYGTFFAIAVVISLPAKALSRTSLQIIAQSWVTNDLAKIGKIYYKTSVVQMLIGCLLFIGLVINRSFIIMLLHKPEYANYFNVFIIVGVAFLVDMTGGLNGYIMNVSKYYKLTTVFIVSGVVFCVLSNLVLIPMLGMMGAALSYLITMFVLNFAYWLFVKIKFNLQPLAMAHVYILLIFTVCLLIGLYLPSLKNVFADMIYRSVIVGVVYMFLAYILKISEDINIVFDRILKKV
ncbi:polysaccharide biosynthesis C-terminal domain-containing protein [Mucilaginibacter sp. P19]|uniref:Membrane protein involved in the export of O-antigen and teichoic acid n=1 Tax=Mucilaginibacter gossypii TaxID=551996 RepID=A0A1G8LXN3_9SPHI|nr:polysaccharide biosynthesis C-terminal domain-containing protein [Mucilaginibacter gossypii]SDI60474.1 Membrane protein involved in the export of O-antigen and teichoic acid [Mucilaginibacter gossypii]